MDVTVVLPPEPEPYEVMVTVEGVETGPTGLLLQLALSVLVDVIVVLPPEAEPYEVIVMVAGGETGPTGLLLQDALAVSVIVIYPVAVAVLFS